MKREWNSRSTSMKSICFKCGATDHLACCDCPKMDDGSANPKKRNIGAYAYGAKTCNILDTSRVECCSDHLDDSMCLDFMCGASNHFDDSTCTDFLCGAAIFPVQDEDECEARAAFLV